MTQARDAMRETIQTINQQLQGMRENALRRGIIIFALLAAPTTLVSVSRGIRGDWLPVFTLQLILLVVLLVSATLRNRLSAAVLGRLLITLCVIVALSGMYTYGTIASAGHWFTAIAVFWAGMLYSSRTMIIGTATLLAAMLVIAWLHLQGIISPAIVRSEFAVAPSSWLVELMCATVFIAIVLPTLRNFVEVNERWMSEHERRREKIAYLAMHDELTGLLILSSAMDRLSMACNRYHRSGGLLAVLFIDLDGFKAVNDKYGHAAGDAALMAVAARLSGRLREQDTVARIGGDEFIVVLENVSAQSAIAELAEDLVALIVQPIEFEGQQLHIGASIGVALCPQDGISAQSLLRNADIAMYRSKRAGGNGVVFAEVDAMQQCAEEQGGSAQGGIVEAAAAISQTRPFSMRTQLKETIITRCIGVLAATLSVTIIANYWRITFNEEAPNLGPALVAQVVALALFIFQKHIPLPIKIALTSSVGLLVALPGLFIVGLPGPGVGWGLAASLFLIGVFYGRRVCRTVAIGVPLAILLSGFGFISGSLSNPVDVDKSSLHPAIWLVFLLATTAYSAVVLTAWRQHRKTTVRLIDESNAQVAELERLATTDGLTGLPSLRLAADRLEIACVRARRAKSRAALLIIDLDGFKAINDTFGHEAGDRCLCEVAKRLSARLRATDTAARIGGDEFLVILDAVTDLEQVSTAAQRLIEEIALPMAFDDHRFAVSASIGIALFPDHGTESGQLRDCADGAMYIAKCAGKNHFQFAPSETADIGPGKR
jgi:diguanylate cyclase (GGDEF)-like protein